MNSLPIFDLILVLSNSSELVSVLEELRERNVTVKDYLPTVHTLLVSTEDQNMLNELRSMEEFAAVEIDEPVSIGDPNGLIE